MPASRILSWRSLGAAALVATLQFHHAHAIAVGELDTFTVNLESWSQGRPPSATTGLTRVDSGGPGGASDPFMRIVSSGTSGAHSMLTVFNLSTAWTGDYLAAGVTAITMSVNNLGATDLKLRVALGTNFSPDHGGAWLASTIPADLPAGSGWTDIQFPLAAVNLTAVDLPANYEAVMSDVIALRLLHSVMPDNRGAAIAATLGVDNILTVGVPSIPGDFDGNNLVDGADLAQWRLDFGMGNGSDADNDADSDGADFLIWQRNLGLTAAAPASLRVPEPTALTGAFCCAALVLRTARLRYALRR